MRIWVSCIGSMIEKLTIFNTRKCALFKADWVFGLEKDIHFVMKSILSFMTEILAKSVSVSIQHYNLKWAR
jgi:hypothetical protein